MIKKLPILTILFLLITLVRGLGTNFSLPGMLVHSDENEYVASVKAVHDHLPSPYKTGFPISSFYYLLLVFYSIYRMVFPLLVHVEDFMLTGRLLSALLGSLSVLFIYLSASKLFGKKAGLLSACFLGFSLIDVQIAHYVKEDIYIQFIGSLSILFLSYQQLWLSLIFAVLAGSAKINGFFFAIPVGLTLLSKKKVLHLATLLILSGLAYFLNTPISFMESDPSKKYSLLALISPEDPRLVMSTNQDGLGNPTFWIIYLFTTGLGPIYFTLLLYSVIKSFLPSLKNGLWIHLSLVLFGIFTFSIQHSRFDRWVTLLTPSAALVFGYYYSNIRSRFLKLLISTGILLSFLSSLYLSIRLSLPDTRYQLIDSLQPSQKTGAVVFGISLDPPKHEAIRRGVEAVDLNCSNLNLAQLAGVRVVINETTLKIDERFSRSPFQSNKLDCLHKVIANSTKVMEFDYDDPIGKFLFGSDLINGPATIRYLHFPQTSIYQVNKLAYPFSYKYDPKLLVSQSTGFEMQDNEVIAKSLQNSNGPYVLLPAGEYQVEIKYSTPECFTNRDAFEYLLTSDHFNDFTSLTNSACSPNQTSKVSNFSLPVATRIQIKLQIKENIEVIYHSIIFKQLL